MRLLVSNLTEGTRYVLSLSPSPRAGSTGKEDCGELCLGKCPSQVGSTHFSGTAAVPQSLTIKVVKASGEVPRRILKRGEKVTWRFGLFAFGVWASVSLMCWPCGRLWRLVLSSCSVGGSCRLALSFWALSSGLGFFLVSFCSNEERRPKDHSSDRCLPLLRGYMRMVRWCRGIGSGAVIGAAPKDRQERGLSGLTNGRLTQEPANSKAVSWLLSGRGHHVPAPTWEGCRATHNVSPVALGLCLMVAVARLAGRWCFWRLFSWRLCFSLACGFGCSRFP